MTTIKELTEIAEESWAEPVDEAGGLFPPSRYYAFFRSLARRLKPRLSVVLGVCGGGDCYHLCLGNPDGKVVGVDIAYDHPQQLEHIKATCPGFTFHQGDSKAAAKILYAEHGPIDFLFIDTDHTFDSTMAEYRAWRPYLALGAIVCFDDLFRPGMGDAWGLVPMPKTRMDRLHDGTYPHGGGFGVHIITEASPLQLHNPGYELGC